MKIKVKIGAIGGLQSGQKKDGTGEWFARDVVLVEKDGGMYPDEFVVRITNDSAKNCTLNQNTVYEAEISFSKREYNGRLYQDLYLRNIALLPASIVFTHPSGSPGIGESNPKGSASCGDEEEPF